MTTRSQLQTSVDEWMIRDDIGAGVNFDEILLIVEAELDRDLRLIEQERTVTLNFTGREADLPADYLCERNPFIDDNVRKIAYMTPKAIREAGPWQNGRSGAFYTLEGGGGTPGTDDRVKMVIAAPASVASPLDIEVNYYARLPRLVNPADTNWLLTNHFDVYLYGCIRVGWETLQEDALEDRYRGKYEDAKAALTRAQNRKRFSGIPKQAYNSPRAII